MKKEKILENLYNLKEQLQNENNKHHLTLENLIEAMQHDIKLEAIPETNEKTRYNAIIKFLNQKHNQSRPILQVTHIENDCQIFTDSYAGFRFFNDSIINQLPKTSDDENKNMPQYPNLNELIEKASNDVNNSKMFKVIDLKKQIKIAKEFIELNLNESLKVRLDKKLIDQFIKILGYKNNDYITINYISSNNDYYVKPLYCKQSPTRDGIILPLRGPKNI